MEAKDVGKMFVDVLGLSASPEEVGKRFDDLVVRQLKRLMAHSKYLTPESPEFAEVLDEAVREAVQYLHHTAKKGGDPEKVLEDVLKSIKKKAGSEMMKADGKKARKASVARIASRIAG
jgi:hypothetical protein